MEDKDCTPAVHGYVKPGTGKKSRPLPLRRWAGAPARRLLRRAVCPLWGQRARTGGGAGKSRGRAPDIGTSIELTDAVLFVKGCFYTYGNCK